jgi:hypothetical protein
MLTVMGFKPSIFHTSTLNWPPSGDSIRPRQAKLFLDT